MLGKGQESPGIQRGVSPDGFCDGAGVAPGMGRGYADVKLGLGVSLVGADRTTWVCNAG